jgi:hypothetical protein
LISFAGIATMKISFLEHYCFDDTSIRFAQGSIGLYFIFLNELHIPYPFRFSRLIYIGMSESKQNSIGNRLRAHKTGQSGNLAIMNYAARHDARFMYHSIDILKTLGTENILELESFFLADFLAEHGAYPICNNQSGTFFPETSLTREALKIDWAVFD